jgi:uncharacterized protein YjbI with pentapeptide repeats
LLPQLRGSLTPVQPQRIELKGTDAGSLFDRELRGVELMGLLRDHHTARACNIIECTLRSFTAERVDFTRCDFKDNAIRSCRFVDSKFDSSSLAYNAVSQSIFEGCSFQDTDVQNCEFEQTVFLRCDLQHLLVKACTFNRCEFRECHTSNKVFEMCRLTDCVFSDTELQVQTIAENFGLTREQLHGGLRDDRGDREHRKLTIGDLHGWLKSAPAHPLQKLSVDYFIKGNLPGGIPIS